MTYMLTFPFVMCSCWRLWWAFLCFGLYCSYYTTTHDSGVGESRLA